jgi:nifR3 family TIM-barrel protein
MNIYESTKKPLLILSPMEDITDTVFRQIVHSVGRPDIFFTEFVNVEGLNSKGRDRIIHRLKYESFERPIVAQLWGINPKNFFKVSKLVKKMGFDGVDINMGCSVKKVVNSNAGMGLIREDRSLVRDIIQGVKDGCEPLPVSVKTRLGWQEYDSKWIQFLLEQNIDVLSVHGRTARGEFSIFANWDCIYDCVKLRNSIGSKTLLLGNGDITSIKQAREYSQRYLVDGVMIGRAAISNPWVFSGREDVSQKEKFLLLQRHINLFESTWGNSKDFRQMRKFFKGYISGFDGANDVRKQFMELNSSKEALQAIKRYL